MKDLARQILDVLDTHLLDIGETRVTLGTLVTACVIVIASFALSAFLQRVLRVAAARRKPVPGRDAQAERGVGILGRLLHYVIVVVGFSMALQTAGIKLGALFAAGAVFAVGVGFAMQNIAQNFVSGVILLIERTIQPGDVLQVEGLIVRVMDMGVRSTLVRTLDEETMIVPNSTLVQSTVRNYTLKDSLYRLRTQVGVSYDSDMKRVRTVLETTARALPDRESSHDPVVMLSDFGSSSVDWEVSVWIGNPWRAKLFASKMREAIWFAFQEAEITIAYPQLDVHFDPPIEKALGGLPRVA